MDTRPGGIYDTFEWLGDADDWSPRIGLAYTLANNTTLRWGLGRFTQAQGIYQLNVEDGDDLFYPVEVAIHHLAGLEHYFKSGLQFRLEGYFKSLSHLRPFYQNLGDGGVTNQRFPEIEGDRVQITPSTRVAKGMEIFLEKENGRRFNWWVSYGLSSTKNRIKSVEPATFFEGLVITDSVAGTDVFRSFDQTHTLYGDITYRPNDSWSLSFAWQYHTGWPFTKATIRPSTRDDGTPIDALEVGPVNGERAPAYHRLDIKLSRNFSYSSSRLTVYLEFLNLYGRKNIRRSIEKVESGPFGDISLGFEDRAWASFIPSLGIRWDIYH